MWGPPHAPSILEASSGALPQAEGSPLLYTHVTQCPDFVYLALPSFQGGSLRAQPESWASLAQSPTEVRGSVHVCQADG